MGEKEAKNRKRHQRQKSRKGRLRKYDNPPKKKNKTHIQRKGFLLGLGKKKVNRKKV